MLLPASFCRSSRSCRTKQAARRRFSPKGWDKPAQGNALGAEERQRFRALKGRDKRFHGARAVDAPFQGWCAVAGFRSPGHCPGLIYCGLFGAVFRDLLCSEHRRLAAKGSGRSEETSGSRFFEKTRSYSPFPSISVQMDERLFDRNNAMDLKPGYRAAGLALRILKVQTLAARFQCHAQASSLGGS